MNLPPKLAAAGLAATLAAIVMLALGMSRNSFADTVAISIETGRSGLVLDPGAAVKMHGVQIGRVTAVRHSVHGSVIEAELDSDAADSVPADSGADIRATTAFGRKYVNLLSPASPSGNAIGAHAVIAAADVTVEINSVFEQLVQVLDVVDPPKLDATLGAIADAIGGRGERLGTTLTTADTYLAGLQPSIPALREDLADTAQVSGASADATPDLMRLLDNLTVTGRTALDEEANLNAVLLAVTGLSNQGTALVSDNETGIVDAVSMARPTTTLFGEYSPGLTCLIQGIDETRKLAEPVSGGLAPSMLLHSALLLGDAPYNLAQDLPKVAASGGPRCGGLPRLGAADIPAPYLVADTGTNQFRDLGSGPQLSGVPLIDVLFGDAAGVR
ncbi:MAG: MCE family protein [Rhodococcus sp. (in: high G+C Gram-positive bacteria)]|uniref:MCE family protein n=1 Tax=Rhodococcus sp. TaxID=1831 RepID=UPI003BB10B55